MIIIFEENENSKLYTILVRHTFVQRQKKFSNRKNPETNLKQTSIFNIAYKYTQGLNMFAQRLVRTYATATRQLKLTLAAPHQVYFQGQSYIM